MPRKGSIWLKRWEKTIYGQTVSLFIVQGERCGGDYIAVHAYRYFGTQLQSVDLDHWVKSTEFESFVQLGEVPSAS